jgi:hypothetical protein
MSVSVPRLIVMSLAIIGLYAAPSFSQVTGRQYPAGPGQADQSGQTGEEGQPNEGANEPPNPAVTPLSGADVFTPSTRGAMHSYLLPSFELTGYAAANPSSTGSHTFGEGSVLGSITLQEARQHSQFNLNYAGGEFFYGGTGNGAGTYHTLNASEIFIGRHWGFQLTDQLNYVPEASFGFAGFNGLSSLGFGMPGSNLGNGPILNPLLQPNQTILAGGRQMSNIAVLQLEYTPRTRSIITVTGGYGTLHYFTSGLIDTNYWIVTGGYNYALTRRDSVAISYNQSTIQPNQSHPSVVTRAAQLQYGRKLSKRLNLQLSGGPLFYRAASPTVGKTTVSSWGTYDSLEYRLSDRSDWGASFMHYTTAGSGVLFGAKSDYATFSFNRSFTRTLDLSATLGYAYNQALTHESGINGGFKYRAWQGGLNITHPLGQYVSVYAGYNLQRQTSDQPVCFGNACESVLLRHVVSLGVNWHRRPLRLQ